MRMFARTWLSVLFVCAPCVGALAGDLRLRVTYDATAYNGASQNTAPGEVGFLIRAHDVEIYKDNFTRRIGSKSEGSMYDYGPATFTVKYDPHHLAFAAKYASHIITIVVSTDGQSTCSANVSVRKRPGHSQVQYIVQGRIVGADDLRVSNVNCAFST